MMKFKVTVTLPSGDTKVWKFNDLLDAFKCVHFWLNSDEPCPCTVETI